MSLALAARNERTFAQSYDGDAVLSGEWVDYRLVPGDPSLAPVVGIHGLGSQGTDLLEVFTLAGVRGLVLDLPGFGSSSQPDRDYPVTTAAERVLELLDQVGLESAVWFGCSYGGHVSLRAALDHPQRVEGLVLVDSGGLDPAPPAELAQAFDEDLIRARPLESVGLACDALVAWPNAATRDFRARRLTNHASGCTDYRAVARSALGALADPAAQELERVQAPVELVHGSRDPLISLDVVERAHRRLPQSTLTVLSGVGHMPWLEAPAQVAARVRRAASRIPSTTRRTGV